MVQCRRCRRTMLDLKMRRANTLVHIVDGPWKRRRIRIREGSIAYWMMLAIVLFVVWTMLVGVIISLSPL